MTILDVREAERLCAQKDPAAYGFKKPWQERDYGTIIAVVRKIPKDVLQDGPRKVPGT